MKKVILMAALTLASVAANADTTIFKCIVPADKVAVTMSINLADDTSADFVTMSMAEKSGASVFFSQMDKGTVQDQLKNGFLNVLAMTEKTAQTDGVIVNTGFLALSLESAGVYSGFLAAKGNIYPLTCKQ